MVHMLSLLHHNIIHCALLKCRLSTDGVRALKERTTKTVVQPRVESGVLDHAEASVTASRISIGRSRQLLAS